MGGGGGAMSPAHGFGNPVKLFIHPHYMYESKNRYMAAKKSSLLLYSSSQEFLPRRCVGHHTTCAIYNAENTLPLFRPWDSREHNSGSTIMGGIVSLSTSGLHHDGRAQTLCLRNSRMNKHTKAYRKRERRALQKPYQVLRLPVLTSNKGYIMMY